MSRKTPSSGPVLPGFDPPPAKESKDARWDPLLRFFAETYKDEHGVTLLIDGSDMKQFKAMLDQTKALAEYTGDALQMAWLCYLRSEKQFDKRQGKPLRFFCTNVNRFMAQIMQSLKRADPNLDAAREYVKSRLRREG